MKSRQVQSADASRMQTGRERLVVLLVAGGVIGLIAVYLALNAATGAPDASKNLLPYQTLARTLPQADERLFTTLRQGLLVAEAERARTSVWPDPAWLVERGVAPFQPDDSGYTWSRLQQGTITNYFGQPRDPAAPAWLLEIQEPEPGMLPDPAPPSEEHHRLPDGTMVHTYVWMHRFGGQVPVGFVRQPQASGWIEVFSTPPNPVFYNRR
jgi:hypothetical protein